MEIMQNLETAHSAPDEFMQRALAFYDANLKAILEPEYDKQFVAIHVNSENYAVMRSSGDAMRAIRKLHLEGPLVVMKIGTEPEYGLAARLLSIDMTNR